jgi:replication factor A2
VTFVGQVRNVSPQTTNITFRLDDGTGIIEVKQWIDADKHDDSKSNFELDQYVRVWGKLKSFNNKRHVGAHVIKPVTDFNEVNYHLLEATYVHLFFTKGAPGGGQGANGNAGDDDSMFVDGAGGGGDNSNDDKVRHCSQKAKKFYNFLHNAEGGSAGIHLHDIAAGTGLSVNDAAAAAEELIGPGVIYTTIDDDTYAILEY